MDDLAPLQTVFTKQVMQDYLRIFNYLWRLKRLDHSLSQAWSSSMAHKNRFSKIKGMQRHFHKYALVTHEMNHFVSNIHNYIMVEVLEASWKILQDEMGVAKDLDELIACQQKFVQSILDKALLSSKHDELKSLLIKLISYSNHFVSIQENHLFNSALQEYDRILAGEDDMGETEVS